MFNTCYDFKIIILFEISCVVRLVPRTYIQKNQLILNIVEFFCVVENYNLELLEMIMIFKCESTGTF